MVMLVFLLSTAAAGLFAVVDPSAASSSSFLPTTMTADALFLFSSSHHRRRPTTSRAPKSGPSTALAPPHESYTKRRPRESRSVVSPLIVFYGMVVGRSGTRGCDTANEQGEEPSTNGGNNTNTFDYENFRGRGRWGGYSIPQDNQPTRAPLPVVSTPTTAPLSVADTVARSIQKRRQERRIRPASPMIQITDIQQYKDEVVDSMDSALVVVRFYAPWCKACKAIESTYHRLPQEFPSNVKFVEVPLTKENAYMHKGLGIPSLPFAHIYYNDDHIDNTKSDIHGTDSATPMPSTSSSCRLVEELKIKKSKFLEFKRIIQSYVNEECDVHYSNNNDDTITAASTPSRRKSRFDVAENEPEVVPVH